MFNIPSFQSIWMLRKAFGTQDEYSILYICLWRPCTKFLAFRAYGCCIKLAEHKTSKIFYIFACGGNSQYSQLLEHMDAALSLRNLRRVQYFKYLACGGYASRFPCCVLSYFSLVFVMENNCQQKNLNNNSQLSIAIIYLPGNVQNCPCLCIHVCKHSFDHLCPVLQSAFVKMPTSYFLFLSETRVGVWNRGDASESTMLMMIMRLRKKMIIRLMMVMV